MRSGTLRFSFFHNHREDAEMASKQEPLLPLLSSLGQVAEEKILRAYFCALEWHRGQTRASGAPYITHPVAVARILLVELGIIDTEMLCAALLHDVIEDCGARLWDLLRRFRITVTEMVFSVTKPSDIGPKPTDPSERAIHVHIARRRYVEQILNTDDWRTFVVKLADVLHNARTLEGCSAEKVRRFKEKYFSYYKDILRALENLGKGSPTLSAHFQFFEKEILKELEKYTHI